MGRPPRPQFAPRLADYRRRRGLTQAQAAEQIERLADDLDGVTVAISANTVARHERGEQWPGEVYRRQYCRLYRATEHQLGLRLTPTPGSLIENSVVDHFRRASPQVTALSSILLRSFR